MAYCMYLRKSRADREAEARGEGETLARHEKTLRELANRLGITVIRVDREIVSGETLASRPVMQKLLREVEAGLWEGVLVMEIERLARGDTIDQGLVARAFKTSGTSILTPLKIYDPANEFDEEYFEFGLFMSRREYKTINRRLQRGRLSSVSEGKYVGSVAPYGYRRIKLSGEKGYTLEPVEQEAEAVRALFSLYASGETLAAVAERLNRSRLPLPLGRAVERPFGPGNCPQSRLRRFPPLAGPAPAAEHPAPAPAPPFPRAASTPGGQRTLGAGGIPNPAPFQSSRIPPGRTRPMRRLRPAHDPQIPALRPGFPPVQDAGLSHGELCPRPGGAAHPGCRRPLLSRSSPQPLRPGSLCRPPPHPRRSDRSAATAHGGGRLRSCRLRRAQKDP